MHCFPFRHKHPGAIDIGPRLLAEEGADLGQEAPGVWVAPAVDLIQHLALQPDVNVGPERSDNVDVVFQGEWPRAALGVGLRE